jgi:hypothetical protein
MLVFKYTGNKQIDEDLGVPSFADQIRPLTERFDSKLAGVGNPLVGQLGRYLRRPRVDPGLLQRPKGDRDLQACRCYL